MVTFAILLLVFHADQATFQTTWFVISLSTELAVVLVLRTNGPAFRNRPSRLLLWTTVAMSVAALTIPFLGPFTSAFGFVPDGAPDGNRPRHRRCLHRSNGRGEGVVLPNEKHNKLSRRTSLLI